MASGRVQYNAFADADVKPTSFKSVFVNTIKGINEVASQPDTLLTQAMTSGNVDIHDIMIANSKAELAINVSSQVVTKALQAYDRILQIQI
jgi:flagellar hook-basal body complex protein FliE